MSYMESHSSLKSSIVHVRCVCWHQRDRPDPSIVISCSRTVSESWRGWMSPGRVFQTTYSSSMWQDMIPGQKQGKQPLKAKYWGSGCVQVCLNGFEKSMVKYHTCACGSECGSVNEDLWSHPGSMGWGGAASSSECRKHRKH